MEMAELRRDAGGGAVLFHQQMKRGAVDRPLLLRQENRAREGSAHLQPGPKGPSFLAHQMVLWRCAGTTWDRRGTRDVQTTVPPKYRHDYSPEGNPTILDSSTAVRAGPRPL